MTERPVQYKRNSIGFDVFPGTSAARLRRAGKRSGAKFPNGAEQGKFTLILKTYCVLATPIR